MKFLVDMPLSPALSRWLTERGHDAVHASEAGLHAASDIEIIERQAGGAYGREAAIGQKKVSEPDWQRFYPL